MTASPNITKVPEISTSHLDQETAEMLTDKGDDNPFVTCAPYQNGYFIWACAERMPEDSPQCLKDLNLWAKLLGHDWVRLDSDSPKAEHLPTYDW